MNHFILLLLVFVLLVPHASSQVEDVSYDQGIRVGLALPNLEDQKITQVHIDSVKNLWLVSPNALWLYTDDRLRQMEQRLRIQINEGMRIASSTSGALALAGVRGVYRFTPGSTAQHMEYDFGSISSLAMTRQNEVWIGSEKGLFFLPRLGEIIQIDAVSEPVNALAWSEMGVLAVGTDQALYRLEIGKWRREVIPGLIDGPITALAVDTQGNLWIGTERSLNVQWKNYAFHRYGGLEGLPYDHITSLAISSFTTGQQDEIWVGTEKGVARLHIGKHKGKWDYYFGPRWLNGDRVLSLDASEHTVSICTERGINLIRNEDWTLARKEQFYSDLVYPRHDRYGFVADVTLKEPGNPESYIQRDDDNDGLWTAIYLASLCFEYSIRKSSEVREKVWHHFSAMEKLESITGVEGFFARTYVKKGEEHERGGEWHESADGEWVWKGDTSSDELVGHMFVYPLLYDLVAQTEEEKQRIRNLVSRIMNYVVDNGYYLLDLDGKPTRWGVWSPEKLNDDPEWVIERGLNSLQILSFLLAAHHITGEQKFHDAFYALVREHDYAINIINQKFTLPGEINHSDDELAFLPYYILFRYLQDPDLRSIFQTSIERAWRIEEPERSPLWNFIYGSTGVKEFGLEEAVQTLREWPLDLIAWPVQNSHRLDLFIHPEPGRFGEQQSVHVLPANERPLMRWNGNPYRLDDGNGHRLHDPGAWLLPYWMGRYHGYIE